jgi:hypothetical protein
MFGSVILSVTHSRIDGNPTLLSYSYPAIVIYGSWDKIKLSDHGCIRVQMC